MKIQGYNQQVGNGGVANAAVQTAGQLMAFGANDAGQKAVSDAIGAWSKVIAQKQEEDDKQSILQAMDAYNKGRFEIMYNADNGVMNTVAGAADGIDKKYGESMKKLRSDVLGGVKLNNAKNRIALEGMMNSSDFEGYKQVATHQYKQAEVKKDLLLSNNLQNNIEMVQQNPASIDEAFATNALMISLRYSGPQGSEELVEAKIRQANGLIVNAAITTSMDADNYDQARQILDKYGHFLSPSQRENISKGINASAELKKEMALANSLYAQYGDNIEAAWKAIDGMKFGANIDNKEDFYKAVAAQESDGDYNATNSRTGAFGKYQIMPENWASWAKEAGLGENAEMSPENQEVVAKYKLGQYFDKYGAEGALVAWYAGEQNARRWVNGEKDAIGENGQHYSWDAPQGAGDEPSIREYVNSSLSKGSSAVDDVGEYRRKEKIKQFYTRQMNDKKRLENARIERLSEAFSVDAYKMASEGKVTYEQAIAEARKRAGADEKLLTHYTNSCDLWYKMKGRKTSGSVNKAELATQKAVALEMLKSGNFKNSDEYAIYVSTIEGVTEKDVFDAKQDYKDWREGKGKFSYPNLDKLITDTMKGLSIPKDQEKTYKLALTQCSGEDIAQFVMDHKRPPTLREAMDIVQKNTQIVSVGEFVRNDTFWGKIGFSTGVEMTPIEMRQLGFKSIKHIPGTDKFVVEYPDSDGRPAEELSGTDLINMRR